MKHIQFFLKTLFGVFLFALGAALFVAPFVGIFLLGIYVSGTDLNAVLKSGIYFFLGCLACTYMVVGTHYLDQLLTGGVFSNGDGP